MGSWHGISFGSFACHRSIFAWPCQDRPMRCSKRRRHSRARALYGDVSYPPSTARPCVYRICLSERSICVIELRCDHNNLTLALLGSFDGAGCLRALRGPLLAFSLHRERCLPTVLNMVTGQVYHLCAEPQVEVGLPKHSRHFFF